MKKFLFSVLISLGLTASPALATNFHSQSFGQWNVFGNSNNTGDSPSCIIETNWRDGSTFQLVFDAYRQELFVWFRNNDWNIADRPDNLYNGAILFTNAQGAVTKNSNMTYILLTNREIAIPNIFINTFLQDFAANHEMLIDMPGNIQTAFVNLNGSRQAVDSFMRCMTVANRLAD